jgi:hypothetical protein
MKKLLLIIFIRLNVFCVLATFVLVEIMMVVSQNLKSREEEMRNCCMPFFAEILATGSAIFISLSAFSIFLNLIQKFRQSKTRIALSFLVFPILTSVFLWFQLFKNEMHDTETILLIITIFFPVWFFITREYLKFSKKIN